jgi:hypothetical protein
VYLIPYLNKGNYLGIDKEQILIDQGIENELKDNLIQNKQPMFVVSNNFEFTKFNKIPNYAIAQSLFTHLPSNLINLCFKELSQHFDKNGVLFATYFISNKKIKNSKKAHDHGTFLYTIDEVKDFGELNGWNAEYIGDWNHPRNQKIVKYTLKNNH